MKKVELELEPTLMGSVAVIGELDMNVQDLEPTLMRSVAVIGQADTDVDEHVICSCPQRDLAFICSSHGSMNGGHQPSGYSCLAK